MWLLTDSTMAQLMDPQLAAPAVQFLVLEVACHAAIMSLTDCLFHDTYMCVCLLAYMQQCGCCHGYMQEVVIDVQECTASS